MFVPITLTLVLFSATAYSALPNEENNDIVDQFQKIFDVEIKQNQVLPSRTDKSLEDSVEDYVKSHDFTIPLPIIGSTVTLEGRSLDNDQLNIKLRYDDDTVGEVEARRKKKKVVSKLRKALMPILLVVLLKALILIPLALGITGFKAWNAIQLSFVSFVVSMGLAIWKLCTKIGHEKPPAVIHASAGWDYDRADAAATAQQLAYGAYATQ